MEIVVINSNEVRVMNKIEKTMLNLLEKVSNEIIVREKNGQSFCPAIFHQPTKPDIEKEKNAEKNRISG